MRQTTVMALGAILSGAMSTGALAWGPEGHAAIANMAEAHLSPAAAAEVTRLLQSDSGEHYARLDDISSWADAVRSARPETAPWHYVDIPLAKMKYNADRDCHYDKDNNHVADETCVVAKLPEEVAILRDKTRSDADRLEALMWVVHLVGDIHQPLHAEDNNNDRGGNTVRLTYNGKSTNLHAVWDGGIIEMHYGWSLGPNYSFDHQAVTDGAKALDQGISAAERSAWASAGLLSSFDVAVRNWANETHALAPAAYAHVPKKKKGNWTKAYQSYAWPVVENQLERAGVRLAEVLNEALE